MTDPTSTNPQVVEAAVRATGLPAERLRLTLRSPLDAQSNNLYDLLIGERHLVVKEFLKRDELLDAPAREHGALMRLAVHDIAPQPVFYDEAVGPVVIYEFMPGTMWDRRVPSSGELSQLADLWLMQHALPTDGIWLSRGQEQSVEEIGLAIEGYFDRYAHWGASNFPNAHPTVALFPELLEQSRMVATELASFDPQLCFCRSDARFANVIARPDGRLGLVDWEDSGLRDPARELGDLLTHPNQEDLLDMAAWQPFLVPYLAGREPLDPTIRQRVHLYLAIFPIFWLAILLNVGVTRAEAGTVDNWRINDLAKNVQFRRYVARALAWPSDNIEEVLADLAGITFFPEGDHGY